MSIACEIVPLISCTAFHRMWSYENLKMIYKILFARQQQVQDLFVVAVRLGIFQIANPDEAKSRQLLITTPVISILNKSAVSPAARVELIVKILNLRNLNLCYLLSSTPSCW